MVVDTDRAGLPLSLRDLDTGWAFTKGENHVYFVTLNFHLASL